MARRIKRVAPDVLFQDRAGDQYEVVSRDALGQALLDWAVVLELEGGTLSVLTNRVRTAVEGEAVTTEALIVWQDRTQTKPQPEQQNAIAESLGKAEEPPEPSGVEEDPQPQNPPQGSGAELDPSLAEG